MIYPVILGRDITNALPMKYKKRVLEYSEGFNSGLPYFSIAISREEYPARWLTLITGEATKALGLRNNRNGFLVDLDENDDHIVFRIRYAFTEEELRLLKNTLKYRKNPWDMTPKQFTRRI